jgi:Rieske Fe-S protein
VSRRALLTGGSVAAASLLAGAGIDHVITEQQANNTSTYQNPPLVANIPTTWQFVAPIAQLGSEAIRFTAAAVIGYVIRQESQTTTEQVIAVSAACTHMGCIVQWQENTKQFLCPCHGGAFDKQGTPVPTNNQLYFTSLPRLETKIENGNIYVKVPLLLRNQTEHYSH